MRFNDQVVHVGCCSFFCEHDQFGQLVRFAMARGNCNAECIHSINVKLR